jgi:hypothetical protein
VGTLFEGHRQKCSQALHILDRFQIVVRAYLFKEAFQELWEYDSPAWAAKFLDEWRRQTMGSRIEPVKKIAAQATRALRRKGTEPPKSGH